MGKFDNQQLPVVVQQQSDGSSSSSRTFLCRSCTVGFCRIFSFKCAVVLIFSVAAFLFALLWILPVRYKQAGFDAKDSIKLSATVQSYFQLQKPVSVLLPYIGRLEYDVNEEIGVPSLKVAVLSMHQSDLSNWSSLSNWTDVVFGFLPDPINRTMNPVALSLLRSSLIDLFLQQYNLTLTASIFGEPSSFGILKFPGGITIIPERAALISQALFSFTLNSSIHDIKENLPTLKEQLNLGLHLTPNEMVYVQITSKHGSTQAPPVTVETSVASGLGAILPERLRQLVQIITGSPPTENLGLDHSVFGKVKEISLSSFLNHSLHPPTPTPEPTLSPSPSPEQVYTTGPSMVPSYPPASSSSPQNTPYHSSSPISDSSAPPSVAQGSPHCGSTNPPSPSSTSHPDQMYPHLSPRSSSKPPLAISTKISPAHPPLASIAHGSEGQDGRREKGPVSPLHVSSSSSYASSSFVAGTGVIPYFYLNGFLKLLLLLRLS